MKIALVGYGKMGRIIEEIAAIKGHEISFKIGSKNSIEIHEISPANTDVCIEFSTPKVAFKNLKILASNKNRIICGTTGWLENYEEICSKILVERSAFLYASNFSIGVNIFFAVNKHLAELMSNQNQYDVSVEEIHHTSKKDAPSGTGLTLTQQIIEKNPKYQRWINEATSEERVLPLVSKRIDPAPGTHTICYQSIIDQIEIKHTAHSRKGFAEGAVLAAEYICDKEGIYTMQDVLNL